MTLKQTKSLKDQIDTALSASLVLGAPGPQEIDIGQGGVLALTFAGADVYGCVVETIALRTPRLAGADSKKLREIGEALARRLTYLLEPIRLIETDAEAGVAQLRSQPPSRDDSGTTWYELFVRRGGEITLERFEKAPAQPRRRVGAHFTREVLLRLASDLIGAVN
jgi:hypothetical protein